MFFPSGSLNFHGDIQNDKYIGFCCHKDKNGKTSKLGVENSNQNTSLKPFCIEYWPNGQIKKIGNKLFDNNGKFPRKQRSEHLRDHE